MIMSDICKNKMNKFTVIVLFLLALTLFSASNYNCDKRFSMYAINKKDTLNLSTHEIITIGKNDSISFLFHVPEADIVYVDFMVQNNSKDYDLYQAWHSRDSIFAFKPGNALGTPLSTHGTSSHLLFVQDEYINGLTHNRFNSATSFHAMTKTADGLLLKYDLKEFYYNNHIIKIGRMHSDTLYFIVNTTIREGYHYKDLGTSAFKLTIDK
jgi:hypothetical protein